MPHPDGRPFVAETLQAQKDRIAELEADNDRMRSALREIVDASNSDAASGGEMFWAEAVGPAVDKAERILQSKV